MRIKVDEDLPTQVVTMLRDHGHDASGVIEQGMGGWKDAELWRAIGAEQRFLVTADKGFADIRRYPPGSHAGILLLRPPQDGVRSLTELLSQVLATHRLDSLAGAVAVASANGVRVRLGTRI